MSKDIYIKGYYRKRHGQADYGGNVVGHWRGLSTELKATGSSISDFVSKAKESQRKRKAAIKAAEKQAKIDMERAREEKNQAIIRELRRRQELIEAQKGILDANKRKIQEWQDLRDQISRRPYKKGGKLSQMETKLEQRKKLEALKRDILMARLAVAQEKEKLLSQRAATVINLKTLGRTRTQLQEPTAGQRLADYQKMKAEIQASSKLPSPPKSISALAHTASVPAMKTLATKKQAEKGKVKELAKALREKGATSSETKTFFGMVAAHTSPEALEAYVDGISKKTAKTVEDTSDKIEEAVKEVEKTSDDKMRELVGLEQQLSITRSELRTAQRNLQKAKTKGDDGTIKDLKYNIDVLKKREKKREKRLRSLYRR